jgi:cell division protein FtsI/penicillin-binding protein 2
MNKSDSRIAPAVWRVRIFYAVLLVVLTIFGIRLFYIQIIRHDHYKNVALAAQLKQYEVPASRGLIRAHSSDSRTVPIVLNQKLYTLYADPVYVKKADKVAADLSRILGGSVDDYKSKITRSKTRYVVISKKLSETQKDKILALDHPGIGAQERQYRTYPQGS